MTVTSYGEYTAENPYHCVFSFIEFYDQDDKARQAVEDALNEYMIPNYHIEVEFLPLGISDAISTIQLMMTGGDDVDVIPIYYSSAPSWISMGGIVDMTPYMDTEDGQKILETIGDENAYAGVVNGVLYGFPAMKESVELGGMFMRKDICDELGIAEEYNLSDYDSGVYPGVSYDWSEATKIFEKVHEAYPNMICLYSMSTQFIRFAEFDPLIDYFGCLNLAEDRTSTEVVNIFETETFYKAAELLAEWYDAGYLDLDIATNQQNNETMMKAGNTFAFTAPIKPGYLAETVGSSGFDGYLMYFKMDGGDDDVITSSDVNLYNTGIATNSKDPEMAFKFITALYTDPVVMNYWQYGIEGENYQILDDGTIYFPDGQDDGNYTYHQNTGWLMGNQMISYVWNDGSKEADYWDLLSQHNDNGYFSPAFGFMWDSSDYSTEITALTNAKSTYEGILFTGACGVDKLDETIEEFNESLYANGLQTVMDAKQAQLDEFLASQGEVEEEVEEGEE